MSRKTNIYTDANLQNQAGSEQGSAQSAGANLAGTTIGAGGKISFTQVTTDAGIIKAASEAGKQILEAQNQAQQQLSSLGLASLENTKSIAENLLERSAQKSSGEPTKEAQTAKNITIIIVAIAAISAIYLIKKS